MADNIFDRDASHRLCFEMFRVESSDYPAICKELVSEFRLSEAAPLFVGLDSLHWDYQFESRIIELGWDCWFGFIVTAKNEIAEPLVEAIGEYLLVSSWSKVEAT